MNHSFHWQKVMRLWLLCGGVLLAAMLWAGCSATPVLADAPTFDTYYPFGTGGNATYGLAGGDIDGDGDLDLVVGNYSEPNAAYLNDGAGGFTAGYEFTTTYPTENVALGDLNHDGRLDLVIGNLGVAGWVYFNDGDGNFDVGHTLPGSEAGIRAQALGDIEGDGDLDITAVHSGGELAVYYNDGAGNFTRSLLDTPFASRSIALGDLDGNGYLDIAIGNLSGVSRIYFNDGAGGFTPSSFGDTATEVFSLALGDVNHDGQLDIVLGYYAYGLPSPMNVYLNQGGGVFHTGDVDCTAPPVSVQCIGPNNALTHALAVADMDADGDADIVAGNLAQQNVVYYNIITGTWSNDWSQSADFGSGNDLTYAVAVGDWNGNGHLDIASGNSGQQNMIYLNDGAGTLSRVQSFGGVNDRARAAALGDMDGDGNLDIVVGASLDYGKPNRVYLNDGVGQFTTVLTIAAALDPVWGLGLGDFDGDGTLDFVTGVYNDASKLYLNHGDATFVSRVLDAEPHSTMGAAVGDLDGNGYLDIILINNLHPTYLHLNQGDQNHNGIWDGAFTRRILSSAAYARSVAVGDLDGDGDLDIVLGVIGRDYIYWNNGAARFTPAALGAGYDKTWATALGDLDGDGDLDIAVGNEHQQNLIYWNENGVFTQTSYFGTGTDATVGLAIGDVDGDGDLDIAASNDGEVGAVYLNAGARRFAARRTFGDAGVHLVGVALGDLNGDGALDIAPANNSGQNWVYLSQRGQSHIPANEPPVIAIGRPGATANGEKFSAAEILSSRFITIPYTLADPEGDPVRELRAFYSLDGGGHWEPAIATTDTLTTNLTAGSAVYTHAATLFYQIPDPGVATFNLPLAAPGVIRDVDVWVNILHSVPNEITITLTAPSGQAVNLINQRGSMGFDFGAPTFDDQATIPIAAALPPFNERYRPEQPLGILYGQSASGDWALAVADVVGDFDLGYVQGWGLAVTVVQTDTGAAHTYVWDVAGSGVFGQSDNVVFRLEAYPDLGLTPRGVPGPYRQPFTAATTFPFRVRGTQVRVFSDTLPAAGTQVYRLPAGQTRGGALLANAAGQPFTTDALGYLQGRGKLAQHDQLLALLPITATDTYTLYYTSGTPALIGVDAYSVTMSGIQPLTVSADHPLLLFNLDVSLEWDAHNDAAYLDQLQANLARASEYLYDFTNGQIALGHVNVFQNADEWAVSHVVINANNRLRPFAAQGGVVMTDTLDPQHADIRYTPGQVSMGSTWNRYGNPGQSLGDDWALILAHELSHYLLFHDDTYLGLDDNGFLIPITTCLGSAMGDLYGDPAATEFIADEAYWQAACADTLPERTLGRNEWETMRLWYPNLVSPTATLTGPALMPFNFTTVQLHAPYTPTTTLLDPTFYADYAGGGSASSEARAYLFSTAPGGDYVVNLGSPYGGQNRVLARGAQSGDRLCVFDRPRAQFGCEDIALGDDRLALREDESWNPILQLTPINTLTLSLSVTTGTPITWPVIARLFPELGYGAAPVTLTLGGDGYTATFHLDYPALAGHLQVWVAEPAAETAPRRETMIAFNVGGNPGMHRGGGGMHRGGGGMHRGGGGMHRGGGGMHRGGGAPLISPDGQLIFFTENPSDFITGTLFAIQAMAGVPALPPGRTLVGQGYSLIASPGAALPPGSISLQYLSNDVLVAGAQESQLTLYFWDGATWRALASTLDAYFNLVTAPSQGPGMYALLASIQIPLTGPGWNLFAYPVAETRSVTDALVAISGYYTTVYGYAPTDPADPWKVFDVTVPEWVNDLSTLEFGKGYWINVSQGITLHLASGTQGVGRNAPSSPPYLPATFYGEIIARPTFTPTAGMTVTAWVSGTACGQTQARAVDGRIVYVVDVEADSPDSPGCGASGRAVSFQVHTRQMAPAALWSTERLWDVPLRSITPPVAQDDAFSTPEDTAVTLPVLENDYAPDGGPLTVTATTLPGYGVVAISGTTALIYTPTLNFNGLDEFTYTLTDGDGLTDTATVTVTVMPVNDPPDAVDDSANTAEDTPRVIAVLGNDTDPDAGDALTIVAVGLPENGSVSTDGATVTYTPTMDFISADSFTYTLADTGGLTDTATVTVNVGSSNDAPIAITDEATTAEDTSVFVVPLSNDTDPDGDTLMLVALDVPAHGVVAALENEIVYTPTLNFNGADAFTYTISDGALTDTATVTVTVTPVNDPPDAVDDSANTAEDTPRVIAVLGNDTDPDADDALIIVAVGLPGNGSASTDGATVAYTPTMDFIGADSFTYTLADTGGLTDTATVTVDVGAANDPPEAHDDIAATAQGTSVRIAVLANDTDPDGDTLTLSALGSPGHGVVAPAGSEVAYTPTLGFHGADVFIYTVSDGDLTDTATVTVTVAPVNTPPTISDIPDQTTAVGAPVGPLLFTVDDAETAPTALTVTAATANPTLVPLAHIALGGSGMTRTLTLTPTAGMTGTARITVSVSDGEAMANAAFTLTVIAEASQYVYLPLVMRNY